jgi:hypothetical protein
VNAGDEKGKVVGISMVSSFLAEKSLTNFLASFPKFSVFAACLSLLLNGSQFIPGSFSLFNLLILLSLEINFKHFFVVVVVGCLRD